MPTTLSQVGGPPARVTINLSILTMGPIDEDTQSFSLDCYFRQSWRDERLGYDAAGVSALALNWAFLEKIWCVCVSAFQLTYVKDAVPWHDLTGQQAAKDPSFYLNPKFPITDPTSLYFVRRRTPQEKC